MDYDQQGLVQIFLRLVPGDQEAIKDEFELLMLKELLTLQQEPLFLAFHRLVSHARAPARQLLPSLHCPRVGPRVRQELYMRQFFR